MLIRNPLGELGDILLDPVILGVEYVDTVQSSPYAVLVQVVVAVATNMSTFVKHQNLKI